jgi:hypothetical protein
MLLVVAQTADPPAWDQASETAAPATAGAEAHLLTAGLDARQASVAVKAAVVLQAPSRRQLLLVHHLLPHLPLAPSPHCNA